MLAAFAAGIDYESLPATVTERTKALLLDLTGIALRARFDADSTPSLLSTVRRLGLGNGHCRVIGERDKFAAPAAALINGALAHSLDFDDTHAAGSIHPSAPIVPAALAAAELMGSDGRELIAAIVAGYEIQIRLSLALVPSLHYERGFHPTATCGLSAPRQQRDACSVYLRHRWKVLSVCAVVWPQAPCSSCMTAPGTNVFIPATRQ